jgi:hypothetical protein
MDMEMKLMRWPAWEFFVSSPSSLISDMPLLSNEAGIFSGLIGIGGGLARVSR